MILPNSRSDPPTFAKQSHAKYQQQLGDLSGAPSRQAGHRTSSTTSEAHALPATFTQQSTSGPEGLEMACLHGTLAHLGVVRAGRVTAPFSGRAGHACGSASGLKGLQMRVGTST